MIQTKLMNVYFSEYGLFWWLDALSGLVLNEPLIMIVTIDTFALIG